MAYSPQIINPYDPRGTTIQTQRQYSPAEIDDMARAGGSAAGAASSLGAATQVGQANQQAGAGAMNTASNAAAYRANPMPAQSPQGGAFQAPYNTWENSKAYANPYAFNFPTGGMMGQQATMDNIKPYLNPYLDQIIANGTNAISHSGAGKGLFGSTGNMNDIGTWATNASSQAYNDAASRFAQDRGFMADQAWNQYGAGVNAGQDALNRAAGDRGYMTDQYWNNRNADTADYWKTYDANWDQYKYGDAQYQGLLGDYYNQNKDITGMEQGGANSTGALYAALGNALAGLYGDSGNAAAAGGIAGSNANRGLIGNILGMFLGGMG